MNWLRHLVSKQKARYIADGYDLDLVYVTPRIIAMGFPSTGAEALYRNPLPEVKRFLEERHEGMYFVYNLCAETERRYDHAVFDGRVAEYGFFDHGPPAFPLIEAFCTDAASWYESDPGHVVVTHCKAGKGRTGCFICALLMKLDLVHDPDEAMRFYGIKRSSVGSKNGVTIPSQRRYVQLYRRWLDAPGVDDRRVVVQRVSMRNIPEKYYRPWETLLRIVVMDEEETAFEQRATEVEAETRFLKWEIESRGRLWAGDFRIGLSVGEKEVCWAWFNSMYIAEKSTLTKAVLDKANKDGAFGEDFVMKVRVVAASHLMKRAK